MDIMIPAAARERPIDRMYLDLMTQAHALLWEMRKGYVPQQVGEYPETVPAMLEDVAKRLRAELQVSA